MNKTKTKNPTALQKGEKSKEEIVKVLNQGASDKEQIINSPALGEEKQVEEENDNDKEIPASSVIEATVRKIEFLKSRIIKDANEIDSLCQELQLAVSGVRNGNYYLNEGIDSIKQGLEYLKDSEGGS